MQDLADSAAQCLLLRSQSIFHGLPDYCWTAKRLRRISTIGGGLKDENFVNDLHDGVPASYRRYDPFGDGYRRPEAADARETLASRRCGLSRSAEQAWKRRSDHIERSSSPDQ